jgi:Na+/H+ antiporter NhaD/arsenite permease-like protein
VPLVVLTFALVYLGMLLGGLPRTALDRTGVALIGAVLLIAGGALSPLEAWRAVDVATITLLFGLLVVSAQLRVAGFSAALTRRITAAAVTPEVLLAVLVLAAGGLSAVLANDVVCLAMAPIVVEGCIGRHLDPRPFLLALAAAANVGSAATLIGNPQNMLIGEGLDLSVAGYLADAGVPALLGLVVVWAVIAWSARGRWQRRSEAAAVVAAPFGAWQSGKGRLVLALLMGLFLAGIGQREVLALAAAALLLISRRTASGELLGRVDGQLLLLFLALFIVNHAVAASGLLAGIDSGLTASGIELRQPAWLFVVVAALSNLVSNVPAGMLLLPIAGGPLAGSILACPAPWPATCCWSAASPI